MFKKIYKVINVNSFMKTAAAHSLKIQQRENLRTMFPCLYANSPHMENHQNRINTFTDWSYTDASVSDIAAAGFYYLGSRDRVKCWYCNGGLQNWDYHDDPWSDHAKWYPSCEFLLQNKGLDFVNSVVERFPNLHRPTLRTPGQDVPPSGMQGPSPPVPIVDLQALKTEVAKAVIGCKNKKYTQQNLNQLKTNPNLQNQTMNAFFTSSGNGETPTKATPEENNHCHSNIDGAVSSHCTSDSIIPQYAVILNQNAASGGQPNNVQMDLNYELSGPSVESSEPTNLEVQTCDLGTEPYLGLQNWILVFNNMASGYTSWVIDDQVRVWILLDDPVLGIWNLPADYRGTTPIELEIEEETVREDENLA